MSDNEFGKENYQLHQGTWGMVPGDGYKLIITHVVGEFGMDRDAAWAGFDAIPEDERHEYLVKRPYSKHMEGPYPTFWDTHP